MAFIMCVNSSEREATFHIPLLIWMQVHLLWMLQLQLSLSNHASVRRGTRAISNGKVWPSRTWGVECKMCASPTHTLEGNPSLWVHLQTQKHACIHTHTCMHHDWGLWVTKVRMRRSDERKSENVRSVDIEHEPTTEGLACVGGDAKRPHVCAALGFDRSGASFLPGSSEQSFYHTHRDLHRYMENQVATHTYVVKDKTKNKNTQKWLNGHTDHSSHRSTWFPQSIFFFLFAIDRYSKSTPWAAYDPRGFSEARVMLSSSWQPKLQ